jgi:hypothetical protein
MVKPAHVEPDGRLLVCGFCQHEFRVDAGQPTCQACPLSGACKFVRCPHCGYENPAAPAWLERVRHWRRGRDDS